MQWTKKLSLVGATIPFLAYNHKSQFVLGVNLPGSKGISIFIRIISIGVSDIRVPYCPKLFNKRFLVFVAYQNAGHRLACSVCR